MPDFAGRPCTLPDELSCWRLIGHPRENSDLLVLGIGPYGRPPLVAQPGQKAFWTEAPEILVQLGASGPPDWHMATPEQALQMAAACNVYVYTPGLRLAPRFWSQLLARIELVKSPPLPDRRQRFAWLPGDSRMLLHTELAAALRGCGYEHIYTAQPNPGANSLREAFSAGLPDLALSVNFRGLDGNGDLFGICRAAGIKVAVWLVDNPWNLLSSIPLPWWQEAHIFVTDASFVEPLRQYGANHAHFLPLAGSPHMLGTQAAAAPAEPPLFVGRSEFPDKARFFSGIKLEPELWDRAANMVAAGQTPDFHWWSKHCHSKLWPGREERTAALGAENSSALRRSLWLSRGLRQGMRIIGDQGWHRLLPEARIEAPVDYYSRLPELYRRAECCLNVTSLLLPQSLSQRHFDVWLAGGFLLTDASRGLKIFERDLTGPVKMEEPTQLGEKIEWLRGNSRARVELGAEWRNAILKAHMYEHRIREITAILAQE